MLSQERAGGRALGARPPASVGGHPVRPCGMAAATTAWAASRRPPRGGARLLMKARGPSSRPLRRALGFPAATARCGPISSVHVSHGLPRGRCGRPPVLRSSSGARPSAAAVSDQRRHTCRASGQRGVRGQRQRTASEDRVRGLCQRTASEDCATGLRQRRWAVRRACEPPSLRLESGLCKGWSSHDLPRTA